MTAFSYQNWKIAVKGIQTNDDLQRLLGSSCLSVFQPAWNNPASTGWISMKFYIWEIFENLSRKSKHTFYVEFPPPPRKSCRFEIMWKNVEPDRPRMTKWRICICWIHKAINTLRICNTVAFARQEWLHECASMLTLCYTDCFVRDCWQSAGMLLKTVCNRLQPNNRVSELTIFAYHLITHNFYSWNCIVTKARVVKA
jgi:hypothetical protein